VREARGPAKQGAVRKRGRQPLDDWFGDISDEDWSEDAAVFAERHRATPVREEKSRPGSYDERGGVAVSPAEAFPVATEARRAAVHRRRAVAAVVLVLLVGLAAAAAVLLLRDGAERSVTPVPESPIVSTPTSTETEPVPTTPSTPPAPTPPAAPSEDLPAFTLPEGTKLQRGESDGESNLTVSTDPELIAELQRALTRAGYDPGSPDGAFGENTEEAVVAFQQANGLSPDGIVGPATADALSRAIAGG
jgi:hypothetical protein